MNITYQQASVNQSHRNETIDYKLNITFSFDSAAERDAFAATMPKVSSSDLANQIQIIDPQSNASNQLRRAIGAAEITDWSVRVSATYALESIWNRGSMIADIESATKAKAKAKFLNAVKWNAWIAKNGIEIA